MDIYQAGIFFFQRPKDHVEFSGVLRTSNISQRPCIHRYNPRKPARTPKPSTTTTTATTAKPVVIVETVEDIPERLTQSVIRDYLEGQLYQGKEQIQNAEEEEIDQQQFHR